MKFSDYQPPQEPSAVVGGKLVPADEAISDLASGTPVREILVHLHVKAPASDRRTPDEIGEALIDQLGLARMWRPGVNTLEIEVALADEVGPQFTPTGHAVGAIYRSSFWGGSYRVLGVSGAETLVEVIVAGPQPVPAVGDRYSTNAPRSPLDEGLESVAWVGKVDGNYGPFGFPSIEAAEHYLAVCLVKLDPEGVEQGHYYIEGLETHSGIPGDERRSIMTTGERRRRSRLHPGDELSVELADTRSKHGTFVHEDDFNVTIRLTVGDNIGKEHLIPREQIVGITVVQKNRGAF